ncbi:MAG: hypothetical protein ACRDOO_29160, partial [Actinomadura sp.]
MAGAPAEAGPPEPAPANALGAAPPDTGPEAAGAEAEDAAGLEPEDAAADGDPSDPPTCGAAPTGPALAVAVDA